MAEFTVALALPAMLDIMASVTLIVCVPGVFSVMVKLWVPALPEANVKLAGKVALESVLANAMVPV